MKKVSLDELMEKSGNKYVLSILSGKKFREMLEVLTSKGEYMNSTRLTKRVFSSLMEEGFKKTKRFK